MSASTRRPSRPDPPDRQSTARLGQLPPTGAGLRGGGGESTNSAVRRAGSGALERDEAENERELDHRDLRALTFAMLDCYRTLTGRDFPSDPQEQLAEAVRQCSARGMRPRRSATAD